MFDSRVPASRRSLVTGLVIGAVIAAFAVTSTNIASFVSSANAQITTDRPANMLSFADIVEKVKPAVVSVRTRSEAPQIMSDDESGDVPPNMERFFRRFFGDQVPGPNRMPRNRRTAGQGSGFFISADGYAVTNNHVIDKATTVEIVTDDGKTYTAKVIGTDPRTDLALLKVDGRTDFPWVRLAASAPRVGDWVLAVGNPFGLGGTVTAGIVSARGRDIGAGTYDDFIQIDAAVNRGNSGGPTFNLAGEVIGVNTAIVSPTGGNIGIAFAIPSETVQTVVAALRQNGTVMRGYLGVQIQPVTQEIAESLNLKSQEGALVGEVQPGLPAAAAGIRSGDIIIDVDGTPIKTVRELQRKIAAFRPDSTVKIKVLREGKEQLIEVKLAKLPDQQAATDQNAPQRKSQPRRDGRGDRMDRGDDSRRDRDNRDDRMERQGRLDDRNARELTLSQLGISVAPASEVQGAKSEGIVVTDVDAQGPAGERGLRTGDVILEIGGKNVTRTGDLNDAIAKARSEGKSVILLRVKSQAGTRYVTLPVGKS
ncbi:MAG: Do family serine endopeptidase [Rhizobiales bacterium]|jgi:serine protease Do|nr:Do family serine endopeptidase [Hyphomicrobiales bacterium]